ncbi:MULTISPECIES: DUF5336 domain-containing protein [unclassified Streptomyces]|uniref:DUF5336 domain-containing protein n=1 Tax=unclassified Streptomyces TaxID=2593676 RepID=UPI00101BF9FB|nr:DUF5336 domain-containing protein [Streptomyces sp. L-9-10]RYJ28913.1 hypothetical protein CU044_2674 [Streptomyces sp. L-9-10]
MNIRSLTRGDGVVIGAAVLLFIASFLNFYESSFSTGVNAWDLLGVVMSIHLAGVIAAALIVTARALPQPRKVVGLDLGQFGVALSVFAAWTGLWYLLGDGSAGSGLILGFIAALILAGAAVATPVVPALKVALIGAPKPQTPQPYGGQPGIPGQGYGYPAGQQPYGTQGQPQPYGSQAGQPAAAAAARQSGPAQGGPSQGGAAPAGDFSPFWFAVPVARPLFGEDGSPSPIAELAPGTWYLAVEQRGPGLVAQTQDGRRGVLQDTSGIQRG